MFNNMFQNITTFFAHTASLSFLGIPVWTMTLIGVVVAGAIAGVAIAVMAKLEK